MSDRIVPVGIVGLGRAGWSLHALTLERLPEMYRVVAVSDPDPKRQEEAHDRFDCRAYAEFSELIADEGVELVAVASPSHLHAPQAIDAMRAGKHVLVEKPFATSLEDADAMIAVSQETGRILTASQNSRYAPDFLKIREVFDSGVLGDILTVRIAWHRFTRRWDWQTLKEFGGGELNNSGSHVIDQALLLIGDAEVDVFCHRVSTPLSSGDAEDHIKVVLKADNGIVVDIECTMACAYPQDRWLVMATRGGLVGNGNTLRWKYFDPSTLPPRPIDRKPTPDRSYNREDLPWTEKTYEAPRETFNQRNRRLYEDLYRTLREGAPLAITPESVRRQVAVLERCRELSPV